MLSRLIISIDRVVCKRGHLLKTMLLRPTRRPNSTTNYRIQQQLQPHPEGEKAGPAQSVTRFTSQMSSKTTNCPLNQPKHLPNVLVDPANRKMSTLLVNTSRLVPFDELHPYHAQLLLRSFAALQPSEPAGKSMFPRFLLCLFRSRPLMSIR